MVSKAKLNEFKIKKLTSVEIALWSIAGTFCLVGLVTFIIFSFGTIDERVSNIFFKGMSYSVIRGWTAFTVSDCYIAPFTYAIPLGLVIVESFLKWMHVNKRNSWWGRNYLSLMNWIIGVVSAIYVIAILFVLFGFMFQDYGFGGRGFNVEFLAGNEYLIPIFVVSILMNATIYGIQVYWFHNRVAKRKEFLEKKLWRKCWTALMFLLFAYIPIVVLKMGFGRPYWFNVHFNDGVSLINGSISYDEDPVVKGSLWRIHEIYGDKYTNDYLEQTKCNYGWSSGTPESSKDINWMVQQWPTDRVNWYWWKLGDGWFGSKEAINAGVTQDMHAFPSGHLQAAMFIWTATFVWFDRNNKSKKQNILRCVVYSLAFIYFTQMVFALLVSASHWWSDMAFTMFWSPVAFYLASLTVEGIFNKLNRTYHTTNW